MAKLARQALASGNVDGAERMVDEALRRDSGDPEATVIKKAVAKARQGGAPADSPLTLAAAPPVAPPPVASSPVAVEPAGPADGLNLVGAPPPAAGPAEGAAAVQFGAARSALASATQTEVQNIINQARGQMRTTPENAIQLLQTEMEKVTGLPELTPEAREQFLGALQAALREGKKLLVEVEQRRQEDAVRRAQGMEQALVANALIRDQQKVKQLIDRVGFLLEEARTLGGDAAEKKNGDEAQKKYGDAVNAANVAGDILPHQPTPVAAAFWRRPAAMSKRTRRRPCWPTGVSWNRCMPSICRASPSTTTSRSSIPMRSGGRR